MPRRSGFGVPYRGSSPYRPAYRPGYSNNLYRGYGRDRRWRGWYGGGYGYAYPGWGYGYPYPYVIDPGFYNWGDTGDYGDDQGGATSQYAPYADYGTPYQESPEDPYYGQSPYPQTPYPYGQTPYPNTQAPYPYAQAPAPSATRPAYSAPAAANEVPLTLIFKDGRKPQTIRNYMMNTTVLTDLDPLHFQRIPLDEIDLDATARLNRDRGVDFEVPSGTR